VGGSYDVLEEGMFFIIGFGDETPGSVMLFPGWSFWCPTKPGAEEHHFNTFASALGNVLAAPYITVPPNFVLPYNRNDDFGSGGESITAVIRGLPCQ